MSGGAKECVNVSELDDIGFGIENISVLKKNTVAFQGKGLVLAERTERNVVLVLKTALQ